MSVDLAVFEDNHLNRFLCLWSGNDYGMVPYHSECNELLSVLFYHSGSTVASHKNFNISCLVRCDPDPLRKREKCFVHDRVDWLMSFVSVLFQYVDLDDVGFWSFYLLMIFCDVGVNDFLRTS